ncbi:MAG: SAM-dependent methyltransferase [Saprospiraceae bacterium]
MPNPPYLIEAYTPFAESLIWQLNRDYYLKEGVDAWRKGVVPHHLTSNALVGRTYAELIYGFLKDLAKRGQLQETVYLIELGAGHGRLAFHILKHLEKLQAQETVELPPYCYILSDIVEDNLIFFEQHPQFETYIQQGILDIAYWDALESESLELRHQEKVIEVQSLKHPLLAIANYFFDTLPFDLFFYKNTHISKCSVQLESLKAPDKDIHLPDVELSFAHQAIEQPYYTNPVWEELLNEYRTSVFNTYLFFPVKGFQALERLQALSPKGLVLISMDKGFHKIHNLENIPPPEMVMHGSFSFWVNYHALGAYCEKQGGKSLLPSLSNFNLELACLFFVEEAETFKNTHAAYQKVVNEFGPDDFNGIKKLTYRHLDTMSISELIGLLRLGAYDSTFFIKMLPRLKEVAKRITFNERTRIAETLHQTWDLYFTLNESFDLAYEMGGLFYDLGFYQEALDYFQHSTDLFDTQADVLYNQILCYYQLRQDQQFTLALQEAKTTFPNYEKWNYLASLDLKA